MDLLAISHASWMKAYFSMRTCGTSSPGCAFDGPSPAGRWTRGRLTPGVGGLVGVVIALRRSAR